MRIALHIGTLLAASTLLVPVILAQDRPAPDKDKAAEQTAAGEEAHGLISDRDITDLPLVRAEEDCANWAWAAAVEAVLRSSGVTEYPQEYWMDKLYGGTVCLDRVGEIERLIKALEGEYVLDDGKHVKISSNYSPGLPVNASELLVPLLQNRVQIIFVNGKAMLFTGARWEDVPKPMGDRTVIVRELRLADLTRPAGQQALTLNPETDDLSQVSGIFRISVAVIQTQN